MEKKTSHLYYQWPAATAQSGKNLVTMQVPGIGMLQRRSDPYLSGSEVATQIMPWKIPFLWHSLALASWRSACAPFPPRKHCWPLVQVLESLLSIDHWHRPAKLGVIRAGRVAHICQKHWVGHMSLAMFYFFLAYRSKLRATCKGASRHKAGMVGWKPPVERYT